MRKIAALLALFMLTALTAACGQTPGASDAKIFRWVSNAVDTTINPHDSMATANYEIVGLIQVALYSWAPAESRDRAVLVPALAAGEPESDDGGYTWRISVSPEAKWQNGEAIDAETFIYSWQMALDPKLLYKAGNQVAGEHIQVAGALEYYSQLGTGKNGAPLPAVSWETVGLKALDAHTLEIKTAQRYTRDDVMRHFAQRYTSPVYRPLYEAGMNADRTATDYGTSLEHFMGCGPFELTEWIKGSKRVFVRNSNFVLADKVKLDGITCRVVADENTALQLFEAGESDYIALGAAGLEKYRDDPRLKVNDQKRIRTLEVNRNNPEKPVLQDVRLRRALYLAIDRQTIAGLTNTLPAPYFISTQAISFADGTAYRQRPEANAWLPENGGYSPEEAKALFEAVLADWGLERLDLSVTYSEGEETLRLASEYIQQQVSRVLGEDKIAFTLTAMQSQAAIDMMRESNAGPTSRWDLCWSGWQLLAETFEPHKKFAPYVSGDTRNYTPYANETLNTLYPRLLTEAYRLDDQATFDLTVEIERSIILDDVTCIPVVQERAYSLFSDRMIHCVDQAVSQLGFGWEYMDIKAD